MNRKNLIRSFYSISLILLISSCIFAEKLAVLPEVLQPFKMSVDGNRLYITERETVYLYSMENFKLLKKFGGKGEGPGEFRKPPRVRIYPEYLFLVDSRSKRISFFTKDGVFIKGIRTPKDIGSIYFVGKNFIGTTGDIDPKTMVTTDRINLYTNEFKFIKKLYNWQGHQSVFLGKGSNKKIDLQVIIDYFDYCVYNGRIYLADTSKGFFIAVYDSNGNKIYDIKKDYKKKRITDKYIADYKKSFRKSRDSKNFNLKFREYFPAFQRFEVNSGKIYVWTYEKKDSKAELIILDLKGNVLKRTFLSWRQSYSLDHYKYYYLFENEDEGTELHLEIIK